MRYGMRGVCVFFVIVLESVCGIIAMLHCCIKCAFAAATRSAGACFFVNW